jgi:hypothetical protein
MTDPAGNFISGWRLSAEQLQNVLAHGGLQVMAKEEVSVQFSRDEALVLFEWVSRFNKTRAPAFEDQAEELRASGRRGQSGS